MQRSIDKTVDYIVVGLGISGLCFCHTLEKYDKSFVVFDDNNSYGATQNASGLCNPIILKWLRKTWNAEQNVYLAKAYYKSMYKSSYQCLPLYKKLFSVEEQNNWHCKQENPKLKSFLSSNIVKNTYTNIYANYGFGEIYNAALIDVNSLRGHYIQKYTSSGILRRDCFQHYKIEHIDKKIFYKGFYAKYIVFCEGLALKTNPYFNYLPLEGNKGETITIKAPNLKLNAILKSGVFIIPKGNDIYEVGATYLSDYNNANPTKKAKQNLISSLSKLISCPYSIERHRAGIRPVVSDRKPLVGIHPRHTSLAVLNGQGSKGLLTAPFLSNVLYNHIENGKELPKTLNIKRFEK